MKLRFPSKQRIEQAHHHQTTGRRQEPTSGAQRQPSEESNAQNEKKKRQRIFALNKRIQNGASNGDTKTKTTSKEYNGDDCWSRSAGGAGASA